MVKNVVFDMGQVIFYFNARYFIEKVGAVGEDIDLIYKELFGTGKWARLDDASMTESQLIEDVNASLPSRLHDTVKKLVTKWDNYIIEVPGMYDLIKDLKNRGMKLYLLSNAGPRHKEYWKNIPASEFFDGVVVSCYEKAVKPDEKLFRILMDRYSLNADECIFIDDLKTNVDAAMHLGMDGFVFSDNIDELRIYLNDRC